jgi:hypothetical protein
MYISYTQRSANDGNATGSVESNNPSEERKAVAGYYTDWIYTGTVTSRNLLTDNVLTQYESRSIASRRDSNTVYSVYTYDVYKRLFIGSNPSEFNHIESNSDEPTHESDKWIYAGVVTVTGGLLHSDENTRYTLRSSSEVLVEDSTNGTLSYKTQRIYDVIMREEHIVKLNSGEENTE